MMSTSGDRDDPSPQDWRIVDPESAGMDARRLHTLGPVIQNQYRNINGVVIVRKGDIVFEQYFNGCGAEDPQHVASVTKSITSALIGIAIAAGHIQSVDQKVLDFFPDYPVSIRDLQKRTITLRHLLTMTAPFAWPATLGHEPLDRLRRQRDWVDYILNLLGQGGQAGKFQYCTAGAHLLSAILSRSTGMSAREFANARLFRPLGMCEIADREMPSFSIDDVFGNNLTGWIKDPAGITIGGWGLTLTPLDMARFGCAYLNKGRWGEQQVIPEAWVEESTVFNANQYGYLWWLRKVQDQVIYSALGSGGNVICCLPEKDLVVAIASRIINKPRDRWQLIEQHILPAVIG